MSAVQAPETEPVGTWSVICSAAYGRGGFASEAEAKAYATLCSMPDGSGEEEAVEPHVGHAHRIEFRPAPDVPAHSHAPHLPPYPLTKCPACAAIVARHSSAPVDPEDAP